MQENSRWHVLPSSEEVAVAVYEKILKAAEQAIAEHGSFKIVLAGGSTPEKVYRLLAKASSDWSKWFIYHGDERCLPVDHADRNSLMVIQSLLQSVAIPDSQVFNIPAELGPELGAKAYADVVAEALPFDMVLLGMGEDGHTASLFPGHVHDVEQLTHAVYNSPKPPPERVSISAKALSDTKELIYIITGANKQEAVKAWRAGDDLPVANITPQNSVDIYIDADAYNEGL